MAEIFPILRKEMDVKIQEPQSILTRMNPKRPTLRHRRIKLSKVKDKEKILKAAREKQLIMYNAAPIRLSCLSQQILYKPDGSGMLYSKCLLRKMPTKNTSIAVIQKLTINKYFWRHMPYKKILNAVLQIETKGQ